MTRTTSRRVERTRKPHMCAYCFGEIKAGAPAEVRIGFVDAGGFYDPDRDVDADWEATVVSEYFHTGDLGSRCEEGI